MSFVLPLGRQPYDLPDIPASIRELRDNEINMEVDDGPRDVKHFPVKAVRPHLHTLRRLPLLVALLRSSQCLRR